MAAPPTITVHNLTGTFDMNKQKSDQTALGPTLKMQGLPWLVRQAAVHSSVQVQLEHFADDRGVEHLDQTQISTGGFRQVENRLLNGEWGEAEIQFWGPIRGVTKYMKISEIDEGFLREGWLVEGEGDVIWDFTESTMNGWDAAQVWGFALVHGERRHVRRIVSRKGKEATTMRIVYDYKC